MSRLLLIVVVFIIILCSLWISYRHDQLLGGSDVIYICQSDEEINNKETNPKENEVCNIEMGTDFFGNTFKTVQIESQEECCQVCYNDSSCKSWTYDTREQVCRLKSIIPTNRTSCPHRVSGTIKGKFK